MKGVILAGGTGSRLRPLTRITNKHLLPVYDKPMIYYPLKTLIETGITEVMIVSGRGHVGHFLELLGSGKDHDMHFTYEIQNEAQGIAQALSLTEHWVDGDDITVILGDNIFEDSIKHEVRSFITGAHVFLKEVPDVQRFGVALIHGNHLAHIEEKPAVPQGNLAVTGAYIYDARVFDIIRGLKPSKRGELEITDVNNAYIREGKMTFSVLYGFWSDAGTFDSLFNAANFARTKWGEPCSRR
jgi:glucose-1-phosphate thymidylyltransferase